jgi:hypothetical protein
MHNRPRELGEPAVARDVVSVCVRLNDMHDAEAMTAGEIEILVDRNRRIDDDRLAGIGDGIRGAPEVRVEQLAEEHRVRHPSRSAVR